MSEFNAVYRKVCLGERFDISAYKQCEKIYNHQQQKIDDITGHIKTLKALHKEGNLTMDDVMMFLKGVEGVLG